MIRKTVIAVCAPVVALCIGAGVAQAADPADVAASIKSECMALQGGDYTDCAQTVASRECAGDQACVDQSISMALSM
ncbi:hypothetical protein ACQP1G_33925 [Nocardia sp. CA-107356]|uniref:hypothetical protein n=1 Tax=Nocardia sp. CA-107356 TaxID=3239972 RepID=UPI003D8D97ED